MANKVLKSSGALRNPFWTLSYDEIGRGMGNAGMSIDHPQLMATLMTQPQQKNLWALLVPPRALLMLAVWMQWVERLTVR